MKHLIPYLKQIEIEMRVNESIKDRDLLLYLSNLSDWEFRIIQDFILRVKMRIEKNELSFVYKYYEEQSNNIYAFSSQKKCDLLIVTLKRDKNDVALTDAINRLVSPKISVEYMEIWGDSVTRSRNVAVQKALEMRATYLFFIDDDILLPVNNLLILYDVIKQTNKSVVAGNYYRKIEPLLSAHGNFFNVSYDNLPCEVKETDLCAMGNTLINIDKVSKKVPFPLFWEFGAPDGYWSMGEDAFFTTNMIEYAGEKPLVVFPENEVLHYDKLWKKMYGNKDNNCVYASNAIKDFSAFDNARIPPKFPLITVCVPTRGENDPIACDFSKLMIMRGYRTEIRNVHGKRVDHARTELVRESIKLDAEFILFVDNDIIPPNDGLCKLIEVMEEDSNIGMVSGEYFLKGNVQHSAHLHLNENGLVTELNRVKNLGEIIDANWLVALGFSLIRIKCFSQIQEPWFVCHSKDKRNNDVNEDSHITELLLQSGYRVIINRGIQCLHVDFNTGNIYHSPELKDFQNYCFNESCINFNPKGDL